MKERIIMKKDITEIIFILDRSGSMCNVTLDTIGGYNRFIKEQQEAEGEAQLTTILFDNHYEILHEGVDIKHVPPLTSKEYFDVVIRLYSMRLAERYWMQKHA